MTPEDIERMAREAGIDAVRAVDYRREQGRGLTLPESQAWDSVTRFAALVRAQALEQAALCALDQWMLDGQISAKNCAAAIRALGDTK